MRPETTLFVPSSGRLLVVERVTGPFSHSIENLLVTARDAARVLARRLGLGFGDSLNDQLIRQ